ncbi:MAG: response regulator [Betaproteobacteria bacterium]
MVDVLLIDDEMHFLKSLAEGLHLYSKKLTIITANGGEKALEILKTAVVDVVVTDLNMPGMDGFEFLRQVQQARPRVPVIIMSAYARPHVEARLKDLQFALYLEKPLDLDEIGHAILAVT